MPHPALLAISHGTGSPAGQAAVAALVEAVAARHPDLTVRLGHVDVQQPDVPATLDTVPEGQPSVIVPLLLSAGFHVRVDLIEQTAGRDDVTIAAALGPDDRLVTVLAERMAALSPTPDDAVVLAVAGSSDPRANDDCRHTADLLAARLDRPVTVGFLAADDPRLPVAAAAAAATCRGRVLVATYLMAPGYFHDLALRQAGPHVARPLLDADPPHPLLVDLVLDRYRAARR